MRARAVGPIVPCACIKCGREADRRRDWMELQFSPCRVCGGEMRRRPQLLKLRADAKAKRDLAEQA